MSTVYTPAAVFPPSFVIPDDGDPKTASSVNIGLQALGDRTQFLYLKGGRQYSSNSALRAVLAPANGDRAILPTGGEFTFQTSVVGAEDTPLTILPTDGTVGSWVNSEFFGLINDPNGAPRMSGFKVRPQYLPYAPIYENAISDTPFAADQTATSTTYVDVTGCSLTFTAAAGDLIFVEAHALMNVDSGASVPVGANTTWSSTIIDPSAGTILTLMPWVILNASDVAQMRSHKFKYVAVGTGSYTVKGQFKSGASYTTRLFQRTACLSVRVVRP